MDNYGYTGIEGSLNRKDIKLIKQKVCESCLSPGITDVNCICVYQEWYPTIELEFEECECCGNISDTLADTEFNKKQLNSEET